VSVQLYRHYVLLWLCTSLCCGFVAGCYPYNQVLVTTQVERLSVLYRLRIENLTGTDICIKPNSAGKAQALQPVPVRPGESFDMAFAVRDLNIGNDPVTPTHEVVSTVFIEGADQPNVARVVIGHGPGFTLEYELDIDLKNEQWFNNWTVTQPQPKQLRVRLEHFRKTRWFLGGLEVP